ncbi:ABC transporter permease [Abyssisolibacter fermentans]|uniref:ABC transporter permease n=1 Tax=Abyssisolibacter fermentans TaxID=1766203 RepID=UPI00138F010E|nr:ABC transporter permease subunit [Abyssisolibacter fermentans]
MRINDNKNIQSIPDNDLRMLKNQKGYKNYSPLLNSIYIIISLVVILIVCTILSSVIGQDVTFPPPIKVFKKLLSIIKEDGFFITVLSTFKTCIITFTIALIIGTILGFLSGFFKPVFYLLQPIITIIKTTPVISIILLALIWFRKITPNFVGFLITFPVIYNNVLEGVRNIDDDLIEMAYMYKVKRLSIVKNIYLPSISSYLFAAISIGWGMTIKSVVTAEVLSQPAVSIGTALQDESIFLETAGVFAWTIVIIILSFIVETFFRALQHRFESWR